MKRILSLTIPVLAVLSLVFFMGCGTDGEKAKTGDQAVIYKVGTDAAYAPFESVAPSGKIEGFDIDIMEAIAKAEGFEVEFVNTAWEGIFASLKGKNDIIISAVTITDKRKEEMDFSDNYFTSTNYIAVSVDSPIKSLADLKGKTVSVQEGTTGDEAITEFLGEDYNKIKRFKGTPEAFLELINGKADAAVADSGVVGNYVKNNPEAKLTIVKDGNFPKEYYGIAVTKGNTELLAKINSGLKKIKENGEYDQIYKKYFAE